MRFLIAPLSRILALVVFLTGFSADAGELLTNSVRFVNAPAWLTEKRMEKVASGVQSALEWDAHRVSAYWYDSDDVFRKTHGMGDTVLSLLPTIRQHLTFRTGDHAGKLR